MTELKTRALILGVLLIGMGSHRIMNPGPSGAAVEFAATGEAAPDAVAEASREGPSWLPAPAALTVMAAKHFLGTPYRWGGDAPSEGFDCSGFVQHVYALNGVRLPRVSRDQARAGHAIPVDPKGLVKGDLLFFGGADGIVDHVAIYAGDGSIIHADSERGSVSIAKLADRGRSARRLLAARRVFAGLDTRASPDGLDQPR